VSVQALTWVLDRSPAEHADRLVLLSLANHAHADGTNAYPSVPTIAREARLGTRAVQYALQSLLRAGAELTPDECRQRGVPTGTRSGPAIAVSGQRGPNGARIYTVLMDEGARAFKTSKRPTNKRRQAPVERSLAAETQTLHPAPATADPPRIAPPPAPPIAPPPTQSWPSEGRNIASRERKPSSDPSSNRHPPAPASGGAEDQGRSVENTERPAPPAGRRRRDQERYRQEVAGWERSRSAASPHADELPRELAAGWARTYEELRNVVDASTFELWLAELHPHGMRGERLVLGLPHESLDWIRGRFGRLIAATVAMGFRMPLEVDLVTCQSVHPTERSRP